MITKKLLFGTDPEVFAGSTQNGVLEVVPPALFRVSGLESDNRNPKHPVFIKKGGVSVIEDGAAFEFTITPSTDWKTLFDRVQKAKALLKSEILEKFTNLCDGNVHSLPTISYNTERWKEYGEEFEMALIFGCDADYDVWNGVKKSVTIDAREHPYRYAGGHIHVSGSEAIKENPLLAVECLATTVGLACVINTEVPELERLRTGLYGRPTKFRPQEYGKLFNNIPNTDFGIEYRTTSVSWTNSLKMAEDVFKWLKIGINSLLEEGLGNEIIPNIRNDVTNAIVNCDKTLASQLLKTVEERI